MFESVESGAGATAKVTIKNQGTDLFGYVKSDDEQLCAADRKVKVFRVKRGDKEKIGTDNASANGNRYQWSLGNTGHYGRFYAKVARTPDCGGDESKTIRVPRPWHCIGQESAMRDTRTTSIALIATAIAALAAPGTAGGAR